MQRSIPFLWGLVTVLLVLVLTLLYGLNWARLTVIKALDEIETTLDDLANEVIVYNIDVNQPVPIKADIPFNQTMEIPLNTDIPIDQELTVPFQIGGGEIELEIPIKADFPVNIVVPVEFNENITVDTIVQLNTTVPVEIDIAQTPLRDYLDRVRQNVSHLKGRLMPYGEMGALAAEDALGTAEDSAGLKSQSNPSNETSPHVAAEKQLSLATPPDRQPDSNQADPEEASSSLASTNLQTQPDEPQARLTDLGLCEHPYWPLRPGTAWTYNSSQTSYGQQVVEVLNDQTRLTTAYEGQPLQLGLTCSQEGLNGSYLGDMRRITEFGQLQFNKKRGRFLPVPEVMEEIGASWAQEFDVTGLVEGRHGTRSVIGHINHGRAVVLYTPTGFETLPTPLGSRQALRIEQKLDLELELSFELGDRTIPATEIVNLTNVYWFVKGVGLVKMHWQGGTIQQRIEIGNTSSNQQFPVPALAEEYLLFVCVLSDQETSECMGIPGISHSDLTIPPESELEIQEFVLPEDIIKDDAVIPVEDSIPAKAAVGTPTANHELPEVQPGSDDDQSALFTYAEAVADVGEDISKAGKAFGEAAIAYRDGEITLDEFRNKFSSFKTKARGLIRKIDSLSPSPAAETIHQKLTGGLAICDEAIDLMDEWFDSKSSGTKEATALLVTKCTDQVDEAASELETLVNQQ